jgi:predicted RNA-binding Zn ribbon-like protein
VILELICLDFLNSDWHDYRSNGISEDRLLRSDWLERFLLRWNLQVDAKPQEAELSALLVLRSLQWQIVKQLLQQQQPLEESMDQLRAFLGAAPMRRTIERCADGQYQLTLAPLHKNWQWIMAEIATSFVELITRHDPTRIKLCDNPNCRWIFYDESKNRSKRWCEGNCCGNLLAVRKFRAKQKN